MRKFVRLITMAVGVVSAGLFAVPAQAAEKASAVPCPEPVQMTFLASGETQFRCLDTSKPAKEAAQELAEAAVPQLMADQQSRGMFLPAGHSRMTAMDPAGPSFSGLNNR